MTPFLAAALIAAWSAASGAAAQLPHPEGRVLATSPPSAADPRLTLVSPRAAGGQLRALSEEIRTAYDAGQLSGAQADRLLRTAEDIQITAEADRDANGVPTPVEQAQLQQRIDRLSMAFQAQRSAASRASTRIVPPASQIWTLPDRERWMSERIERGAEGELLSGAEVQRGEGELAAIRSEQAVLVRRDGGALTPEDRRYLANRIDLLNDTLQWTGRNPPPPWAG